MQHINFADKDAPDEFVGFLKTKGAANAVFVKNPGVQPFLLVECGCEAHCGTERNRNLRVTAPFMQ